MLYGSYSIANKEPNRSDYVESSANSRPKHETLYDTEFGYKYINNWMIFNINLFNMNYDNQLIKTGEINDVGYFTSKNVESSFRRGIEIEGAYEISKKINISGNLTISENKVDSFTQFIDNWDTWGQEQILHENTDLAFSPN